MKKYEAIIYDIDGTILDTLKMNMIPLMKIIEEETGKKVSYEEVLQFAPYPGMKVMEELGVENKEKTYERWVKYVNAYEDGATIFPEMKETLEAFHGHIIQAVVSAKTKKQYQIDMVDKGLDQYMQVAVLADDTTKHKPDPEPILKCLDMLSMDKEKVIYIGDTYSDYQAANHAGVDFGFAVWGSYAKKGIDKPTYIFNKPSDLLQLLNK